ncbi:MAG: tyrosine-type recombinase/integrase [Inquilinus sp.]|uniref:tyrosine-type recombinase/integrase n=1 Tax=Inquilinus sp. TaxID=1932117 RepID=UPI003F3EC131
MKDAAKALKAGQLGPKIGRLGDLRVDQVNQDQWDRYAASRMTKPRGKQTPEKEAKHKPKPVAAGTLRREFNVLRAALRRAWKDGFLVKPPELEAPADSAPRDRYLTKAEARKLVAACITPHVKTFVALAVYTGGRKGAILALTWDRVNFDTGMVDLQEPGRRITSKRRGVVPMNAALRAELEEARQLAVSDYVVEYGGGPVPKGLRWSFRKLCLRAGLTWIPTPHHLKHSVASWMAMERVPVDQAADYLATDPRTLRKVYRKFDPSYLQDVADALAL